MKTKTKIGTYVAISVIFLMLIANIAIAKEKLNDDESLNDMTPKSPQKENYLPDIEPPNDETLPKPPVDSSDPSHVDINTPIVKPISRDDDLTHIDINDKPVNVPESGSDFQGGNEPVSNPPSPVNQPSNTVDETETDEDETETDEDETETEKTEENDKEEIAENNKEKRDEDKDKKESKSKDNDRGSTSEDKTTMYVFASIAGIVLLCAVIYIFKH